MLLMFGKATINTKGLPRVSVMNMYGHSDGATVYVLLESRTRAAVEKWAKRLGVEVVEGDGNSADEREVRAEAESGGYQVCVYTYVPGRGRRRVPVPVHRRLLPLLRPRDVHVRPRLPGLRQGRGCVVTAPAFIRGVRVPAGARLPLVVTDEWLAAVTEAAWHCLCQRFGDRAGCTHVGPCDKGAAYRLVLDEAGRVLCTRCAATRAKKNADQERTRAAHLLQAAQASLLDLIEGAEQ